MVLQAELNRYTAIIHILQDYCKSVSPFCAESLVHNELEEALEIPSDEPVAAGKGKGAPKGAKAAGDAKAAKGGKGAPAAALVFEPFREPLSKSILLSSCSELPIVVPEEEAPADPKAKGKAAPAKVT